MRTTRVIGGLSRRCRFSTVPTTVNPAVVSVKTLLPPIASYEELVRSGDITEDTHQRHAVEQLQQLYDQVVLFDATLSASTVTLSAVTNGASSWYSSLFSSEQNVIKPVSTSASSIKGLYMYGGTGCGKTFIMDLFFEVVPIKRKRRVHFNNFMIDIHKRLHRLKSSTKGSSKAVGDSIMEQITNELMDEAYLLCFDEFQVTDIADAMILKSLFESMLAKGAIVVATSNRPPLDLYKNGLQRVLFLPFIKTLNDSTNVLSLMESSMDYRIVKSTDRALNMYLSPINPEGLKIVNSQFKRLSVSISQETSQLQVYDALPSGSRFAPLSVYLSVFGHQVHIPEAVAGRRIARFSFEQLCSEALGAADYIHLAETFRVIFITNVPILNLDCRNEMRRFINLIDALYEESVQVVVLAAEIPTKLLQLTAKERASPHDEVFAFDRTISRLLEMQSQPYLQASIVRYPVEAGGHEWLMREFQGTKTGTELSESIWRQYNWHRGTDVPLPLSALQVLLSDLLVLKKNMSPNSADKHSVLELDMTIENIREKIFHTKEKFVEYEDYSNLLFHTN